MGLLAASLALQLATQRKCKPEFLPAVPTALDVSFSYPSTVACRVFLLPFFSDLFEPTGARVSFGLSGSRWKTGCIEHARQSFGVARRHAAKRAFPSLADIPRGRGPAAMADGFASEATCQRLHLLRSELHGAARLDCMLQSNDFHFQSRLKTTPFFFGAFFLLCRCI